MNDDSNSDKPIGPDAWGGAIGTPGYTIGPIDETTPESHDEES